MEVNAIIVKIEIFSSDRDPKDDIILVKEDPFN